MEQGDEEMRRLKKELTDASKQNCDLVKKLENMIVLVFQFYLNSFLNYVQIVDLFGF